MDIADWGPFVATFDKNGNLHIYNYIEKTLNLIYKFHNTGSQIIWLPCNVNISFFLFSLNNFNSFNYFIKILLKKLIRLKKQAQHLYVLLKMVLLE